MTSEAARGLRLTLQAIRRQLAAMPHDLYVVRLIHNRTRRPYPGERLWTATQLLHPAIIRFLRIRNREGCDVYIYPYADIVASKLLDVQDSVTLLLVLVQLRSKRPKTAKVSTSGLARMLPGAA